MFLQLGQVRYRYNTTPPFPTSSFIIPCEVGPRLVIFPFLQQVQGRGYTLQELRLTSHETVQDTVSLLESCAAISTCPAWPRGEVRHSRDQVTRPSSVSIVSSWPVACLLCHRPVSIASLWLYCHRSGGNSHSVAVIATGYLVAIATAFMKWWDATLVQPFSSLRKWGLACNILLASHIFFISGERSERERKICLTLASFPWLNCTV